VEGRERIHRLENRVVRGQGVGKDGKWGKWMIGKKVRRLESRVVRGQGVRKGGIVGEVEDREGGEGNWESWSN
jgi:hypothetical protein